MLRASPLAAAPAHQVSERRERGRYIRSGHDDLFVREGSRLDDPMIAAITSGLKNSTKIAGDEARLRQVADPMNDNSPVCLLPDVRDTVVGNVPCWWIRETKGVLTIPSGCDVSGITLAALLSPSKGRNDGAWP
jgi:hypothetical protein